MSWQAYVDSSLVGTGYVDKGALCSVAGDSVWASTEGFNVTPNELKEVVKGLNGETDDLWAEGLHIAGDRYVLTKAEGRVLLARKGKAGVVIVKTTQAILISYYDEDKNQLLQNASTTTEKLADYLIGQGY
ncbi:hypothetical protein B7494_g4537 [Chlorociboria aeruginascens]|nr:hypothetical protein B7494_g4537 [Chlorociboria aeruginascens]